MISTIESLRLTEKISNEMDGKTFHHHYHILYDIVNLYPVDYNLTYVEIGCYAGGSACLVGQRKKTNIISIDLGTPIYPDVPKNNFKKFNIHGNSYKYIQGNSQSIDIVTELKKNINSIDVLFIDGDHTYGGVIKDFELYSPFVSKNGYIIFDDYNDSHHSPDVKKAVNNIIEKITNYEIIGTIPNTFNARPKELTDGNCFIIKKII
jgi:cephalosporin hydroxylase